jgi:HSP20 family molecular chaperone IbpA
MAAETSKLMNPEPQSLNDVESRPRVAPPVDVYENSEEILLYADMPGVDGSALDLSFDRGQLTIHARREGGSSGRELRSEYQASDYYRRFAVPPGVDASKIHAELKNGVLHLHLPKSDALKPRQIPVQAG